MQNQKPTVPPFAGVGKVPNLRFRGITTPTDQFASVQNQLVTPPLSGLIDLSTARSIAAGTALQINVAGNSFYLDANLDVGNAVIHFQDVSQQIQQQGMYIGPQFIAKIPFTRFLLENLAQPGKVFRFFYGVDVDFSPGLNNQVSIAGIVSSVLTGAAYGASYASSFNNGAGLTVNPIAPGSNVNGVTVYAGDFVDVAAGNSCAVLAKSSAPGTSIDGDPIIVPKLIFTSTYGGNVQTPLKIAIGKGVYFYNSQAETGPTYRALLFTIA